MDERLELFALPSFIERMVKIAPNLDLASVHFDPREVAALLANGAMDVVVGAETLLSTSLSVVRLANRPRTTWCSAAPAWRAASAFECVAT